MASTVTKKKRKENLRKLQTSCFCFKKQQLQKISEMLETYFLFDDLFSGIH